MKSAANKAKHGIDFVEAQALWSDPDRIEFPARPTDEPRFLLVGQIKHAVWTATVTYRHEEAIRIISSMPKWVPARKNGEVVRSRLKLPISFYLNLNNDRLKRRIKKDYGGDLSAFTIALTYDKVYYFNG